MLLAYTLFHVLISLIGIASGFVVIYGMLVGNRLDSWTALFLWTTVATSVTGFFFPVHHFMPSHGVGILSLLILPVAIYARYGRQLAGHWRATYVIAALLAQYLNVFVLVVQSFLKVPPLHALAPTQAEPAFKIAQLTVLVLFIALGIVATLRFRTEAPPIVSMPLQVA
jgi:hypothetical protein